MVYLEPGDLLCTMRACRTLFQVGIPILLRDVQLLGLEKTRERRYALYRRHLLKDPARFSCVMSLACSYSALDKQTRSCYLALPRNFKSLRALTVDMEGKELDSSLSRWILSQTILRELKLQNVGREVQPVMDLIQNLGASLEVLQIHMMYWGGLRGPFDPIPALLTSSHSLRSLSIRCHDSENGPSIGPEVHIRCPVVQDLHWVTSRHVQTSTLIQTFPSLRNLHIGHAYLDDYISMLFNNVFSHDQLLDIRQRNQHAQRCQHMCWASLESLQGGLLTLWTLALRCRVVRLDTSLRIKVEKVGHLLVILHDTWPENLVLSLFPEHVVDLDRVLNFPSLQTLNLVVYVVHKTDLENVLKLLVSLTTAINIFELY